MNLVEIANVFNTLCQLHPEVGYFHYGWRSDVNLAISNNFAPDGVRSYPYVHMDFTKDVTNLKAHPQTTSEIYLIVSVPQGRDNLGQGQEDANTTIVEQQAKVKEIGLSLIRGFVDVGRNQYSSKFSVVSDVDITYSANYAGDQLVVAFFNFSIRYADDCPQIYTDYSLLPPNFQPLPVSGVSDYEKEFE